MEKYLSVTTLTKYLKMKFDKDPYLERVYLTGQVSNFRKRPTHQYFSLKDDHAVIRRGDENQCDWACAGL